MFVYFPPSFLLIPQQRLATSASADCASPLLLLSHSRGVRPDERWESAKNRGGSTSRPSGYRTARSRVSFPPPAFFPLRRSDLRRRPRPQRDTAKTAAKTYWIPALFDFDGVALPCPVWLVGGAPPEDVSVSRRLTSPLYNTHPRRGCQNCAAQWAKEKKPAGRSSSIICPYLVNARSWHVVMRRRAGLVGARVSKESLDHRAGSLVAGM